MVEELALIEEFPLELGLVEELVLIEEQLY
jgi:hypothetical protein